MNDEVIVSLWFPAERRWQEVLFDRRLSLRENLQLLAMSGTYHFYEPLNKAFLAEDVPLESLGVYDHLALVLFADRIC